MPIIEAPQNATQGANTIRRIFRRSALRMDEDLAEVRRITNRHGRAALATALGSDGPELLSLYNKMRTLLESAEVGLTVDPLP